MEAATGMKPPLPQPPHARPGPHPGLQLPLVSRPSSGSQGEPASSPPRPRGTRPGSELQPGRIPSSQNAHALPSPIARPSRSSQNPRPFAAPAGPPPPGARRGRGSGPAPSPRLPRPIVPGGRPGPSGPPPRNPGVPNSRLWGLGKAGRQNSAPGDLTP